MTYKFTGMCKQLANQAVCTGFTVDSCHWNNDEVSAQGTATVFRLGSEWLFKWAAASRGHAQEWQVCNRESGGIDDFTNDREIGQAVARVVIATLASIVARGQVDPQPPQPSVKPAPSRLPLCIPGYLTNPANVL